MWVVMENKHFKSGKIRFYKYEVNPLVPWEILRFIFLRYILTYNIYKLAIMLSIPVYPSPAQM